MLLHSPVIGFRDLPALFRAGLSEVLPTSRHSAHASIGDGQDFVGLGLVAGHGAGHMRDGAEGRNAIFRTSAHGSLNGLDVPIARLLSDGDVAQLRLRPPGGFEELLRLLDTGVKVRLIVFGFRREFLDVVSRLSLKASLLTSGLNHPVMLRFTDRREFLLQRLTDQRGDCRILRRGRGRGGGSGRLLLCLGKVAERFEYLGEFSIALDDRTEFTKGQALGILAFEQTRLGLHDDLEKDFSSHGFGLLHSP